MASREKGFDGTRRLESRGFFDNHFGLYESRIRIDGLAAYALSYVWPEHSNRMRDIRSLIRVDRSEIGDYKVDVVLYRSELEYDRMSLERKLHVFAGSHVNLDGFESKIKHDPMKTIGQEIEELLLNTILKGRNLTGGVPND